MCSLNVYSINNKFPAIQHDHNRNPHRDHNMDDRGIRIMIITETRIQEGGYDNVNVEGMARVSACGRKTGQTTGRVAIYVHDAAPCYSEYNQIVHEKREVAHCAAAVFPDHTRQDRIQVVGAYRPPGRNGNHPPITEEMATRKEWPPGSGSVKTIRPYRKQWKLS